jgi:hypothetical protein
MSKVELRPMTPEERLHAANDINGLWLRHLRRGDAPPDADTVSRIIERYELGGGTGANGARNPPRKALLRIVDSRRS